MASNYTQVLAQMQAHGLLVDRVDATGLVVRCKIDGDREKRGWYCLHELPGTQGDTLLVGSFGIWHGNDNGAVKVTTRSGDLTAEQAAALRDRLRDDARRATAARKAEAERAALRAEQIWRKCRHDMPDTCDYLARKGIQGHGVRYTDKGAVVIPMHDGAGRTHGLQFILSRRTQGDRIKRLGRDKEYWPAGLAKQGHWFQLGVPAGIVLLCEGYATAASLHEATGLAVIVAFDANNLAPVARALRKRYPDVRILVCADDDFATLDNPGVDAASAAAMAVGGAWVAPVFADSRQIDLRRRVGAVSQADRNEYRRAVGEILQSAGHAKATDFNDLHQVEGLVLVRQQIELMLDGLGWRRAGPVPRPQATGGEGADAKTPDWRFDLERLLVNFALIYGTDTVFDSERAFVLGLGPLRAAAGKGLVRSWLEHPERRTVLQEEVGFDPAGTDPKVKCNLWSGWPTKPKAGDCSALLSLIEYLCNSDPKQQAELYQWLIRWFAYPIQYPGAKMDTAVLMHGPEGAGKNTIFSAIRKIYGRYAVEFSQVEIESQFNGWASGKLFGIGNEVVSRAELYHIQGRLKGMVTGDQWVINEKMLPARSEQNHCNFVFDSNRIDIAKLDGGDRRYCVIWTPPALSPEFYAEVAAEIRNGGVEALHHHLLHLDLGDFDRHTKPPNNAAKRDLVELGMDSTERFFRDWLDGNLDLPAVACVSQDLYSAYKAWTLKEGIGKPAQKQTLLTAIGKRPGVRKSQERFLVGMEYVKRMVVFPPGNGDGPEDGASRSGWISEHVADFAAALTEYQQR